MGDFFLRTEDIRGEEVLSYFVETKEDRKIIDALKGVNPIVLSGSRGVGKSFLLRVAQAELLASLDRDKVFPVYVTFTKSSLISTNIPDQFKHWMLAKIAGAVIRCLSKEGLMVNAPKSANVLAGEEVKGVSDKTKIEAIAESFEESWRGGDGIDVAGIPDVDSLKEAVEDLCYALRLRRIALFIDEAAHIFLPEQQRQFFTLYRDLRSPYMTCNAAVYPGVTSYGDAFQPVHDATVFTLNRDITSPNYVGNMREIVERQAESKVLESIVKNGENFSVLAYAASGNPRILLKTLSRAPRLKSTEINEVIREYYRTELWSEHSLLAEKYPGHRVLIDWARKFVESYVLPEISSKNFARMAEAGRTSCYFWMHRDAPEAVQQALRILCYTGIVSEQGAGIKASRGEIGTRYAVNLGSLFALESVPANTAFYIGKNLSLQRMTEYGANHAAFVALADVRPSLDDQKVTVDALKHQMAKDISNLDLTGWQIEKLRELGLNTIGDILDSTEQRLRQAHYVGEVRSRRMRNAAFAATYEYLSG